MAIDIARGRRGSYPGAGNSSEVLSDPVVIFDQVELGNGASVRLTLSAFGEESSGA